MNQLICLLVVLSLLPLARPNTISLYVDDKLILNGHYVTVASTTRVKCRATHDSTSWLSDSTSLQLLDVSVYRYNLLESSSYADGWDLSVVLTGLTDRTDLRCQLSSGYSAYQYVTLTPSATLPLPYLPPNTDKHIALGTGFATPTSSTSSPTGSGISFGSTYIIYVLVIVIFLSFLASTGAVACWMSARLRANRARLQRAHAARVQQMQEAMGAQSDTVVLTHLQVSGRQDAPPPYEGAPINTTISLHIDSAPPCYQEALTHPATSQEPSAQSDTDAPPAFEATEPLHTSNQSLEVLAEETDRLLQPAGDQ